ncbi:MAG: small basic protein [Candidatus Aureabacteria bacterium]|nr:small basic protein [Candidatus Auribacterota bacterium]
MSQHKSLKMSGGGLQKKRSVLKRWERIDELRKQGRYQDGAPVQHLPKTKASA